MGRDGFPPLTVGAAVLWVLHTKQPLSRAEIIEEITKIPKFKKYEKKEWRHLKERVLPGLEKWGILKTIERGGETLYAFKDFTTEEEATWSVLSDWRKEFEGKPYVRPLFIDEIMYRLGKSPERMKGRIQISEIACRYGWSPYQDRLVNHSKEDLKPALETWLKHLEPHEGPGCEYLEYFYGLGSLDIYGLEVRISPPRDPEAKAFGILRQHLENGCPELLCEWKQLCGKAKKILGAARNIAQKIMDRVVEKARELGVTAYWCDAYKDPNVPNKPRIYEMNCTSLIYRALKGGTAGLQKDIRVEREKDFYNVLPGPCAAVLGEDEAEKFADFLRQEISSEEGRREMVKIGEDRRELEEEIEKFKATLSSLMSKIDEGYYLKGWCGECEHIAKGPE
jgi:hypothetical protein